MTTNRVRARIAMAGAVVALMGIARPASATSVDIGFISFDGFIPGAPGSIAFTAANFTGTSALPFDFTFAADVQLSNATFEFSYGVPDSSVVCTGTPTVDGCDQAIVLGTFGPGSVDPLVFVGLQLPSTAPAFSARFSALLPSQFDLGGGLKFLVDPSKLNLSVDLLPSDLQSLVAGESVVFSMDGEFTQDLPNDPVPEPATLALVGTGLAAAFRARRRKH